MGLFGSKAPKGPTGAALPDWSSDPIVSQHRLADAPPELYPLAQQLIQRAGRGSLQLALERLYTLVGAQMDSYAAQFPELRRYDFAAIREQLLSRQDFEESMLFTSLTYFGPAGVAMNNGLIEQVPVFVEVLEQAARQGHLDG